jgi:beta-fructofuranosidase
MNRRDFLSASALLALRNGIPGASALAQNNARLPDAALREKLMHDPLRPQFHLLPIAGFVGDPCAPRFFEGHHHVFFHGSYGGRGWQHAMSADLIHWEHVPIALAPTEGTPDAYGTFTGGVLPGGDGGSIVYTAVTKVPREQETIRNEGLREVQCTATSMDPELRIFQKRLKPIVDGPPPGLKVTGFRDPFSWKDGDTRYLGVGSGFPQVGGAVLLYRSHDAVNWEYLHPLAEGVWNGQSYSNPVPSGEMWECPDLFPLGEKHVLFYSTEGTTRWEVGTFDKQALRFHSENKGILDHGAYYAPRSNFDEKGRRILWGWIQERRPREETLQAGWNGSISLPRVLTLSADNQLQIEVAPEIESLRRDTVTIESPATIAELDAALAKAPIHNRAGEIVCAFHASQVPCTLELQLVSGATTASIFKAQYSSTLGKPVIGVADRLLPLAPDSEKLSTIHLWIDGSVIEAFFDKRQVFTSRFYDLPDEQAEIRMLWSGAPELLKSVKISQIAPISPDRLTT